LARVSDEVRRGEWLWVEERITGLLDSDDGRSLFVQGCVRNQSKFYDRFNVVVLLSAPADVILDRIARRTTNNYGKMALERLSLRLVRRPLGRRRTTPRELASRSLAVEWPTLHLDPGPLGLNARPRLIGQRSSTTTGT